MNIIVNVSENWAIGKGNSLLFHLSEDMKFFKSHTVGKVVVMGRKTLESLPKSSPLPNRVNIVLTKNKDYQKENAVICNSIDELLGTIAQYKSDDVYIIGGEAVYRSLLPYCDRAFVTKVSAKVPDADAFMVNLDESDEWEIESESEPISEKGYDFKFVTYKRR